MRANIIKDIRKVKVKLILKAKSKGIYENFGQKENNELKDKWDRHSNAFPNSRAAINQNLDSFFEWAVNFDQKQLESFEGKNEEELIKTINEVA